jgi:hypothetical protein
LRLTETFGSVIGGDDEFIDVTLLMAVNFTDADRTVIEAKLRYTTPDEPTYLAMKLGLRSQILKTFPRFSSERQGRYLPCDIPSLVPAVCIMVSSRMRGLDGSVICDHETNRPNHIVLTFKGEGDLKRSNIQDLAICVHNVMERWKDWTDVLLRILKRDPKLGNREMDWREFLAGESGWVTMPWFPPMSYHDRSEALSSIVNASNTLLTSFLSPREKRNILVLELQEWLRTIEPLVEVQSTTPAGVLEVT